MAPFHLFQKTKQSVNMFLLGHAPMKETHCQKEENK
jgi:hypothetical protein